MVDAVRPEFLSLTVGATVPSGNGRYLALSWPLVRLVVLEQSLVLEYRELGKGACPRRVRRTSGEARWTDSSGGAPPPKT